MSKKIYNFDMTSDSGVVYELAVILDDIKEVIVRAKVREIGNELLKRFGERDEALSDVVSAIEVIRGGI
jgi:hypothetical protein